MCICAHAVDVLVLGGGCEWGVVESVRVCGGDNEGWYVVFCPRAISKAGPVSLVVVHKGDLNAAIPH